MRLTTDYPWYFLLLCVAAGLLYAFALYWFRRREEERKLRLWLSLLRCLSVAAIVYLLLAPMVRQQRHEREKPIVIIAQDNSQSLVLGKDSTFIKGDYLRRMSGLKDDLTRDYEVREYVFGETLRSGGTLDFGDRSTDMASALHELEQHYTGRNVGALILAGDGIVNAGGLPTQFLPQVPIYAVALGDTTLRRDASVAHLRFNRVAYLGNDFPVEITVRATALGGKRQRLSISRKGKELFSETIDYQGSDFSKTVSALLSADEAGLMSYVVSLTPAEGESSLGNNRKSFTVEVIDGHKKVAIVAATPHPDIAALRHSIEQDKNFEVEVFIGNDWRAKNPDWAHDYDLLVLHGLPRRGVPLDIDVEKIPAIIVLTEQSDIARFNLLHLGVEVVTNLDKRNEVTAAYNNGFSNFSLSDHTLSFIGQLPPLSAPFGDYRLSGNTSVLLTAGIGGIATEQPLVALSQTGGVRHVVVAGEGLWRWRLYDYMENSSHEAFDELTGRLVTYASLRATSERLRVESRSVYFDNEPVVLEAEFYDDNFEPTNDPEAELTVGGDRYLFGRSGNGYRVGLGRLDTGLHTYTAAVSYDGHRYTASGRFAVESHNLEDASLVANHTLLNTLAQRSGGALLYPDQMEQLPDMLRQRDDIKPVIYSHATYSALIDFPWVLILILLLLAVEWIARKYNGKL